ncbi:hypothetical protein Tco_0322523 [Tanacetum coccineum]
MKEEFPGWFETQRRLDVNPLTGEEMKAVEATEVTSVLRICFKEFVVGAWCCESGGYGDDERSGDVVEGEDEEWDGESCADTTHKTTNSYRLNVDKSTYKDSFPSDMSPGKLCLFVDLSTYKDSFSSDKSLGIIGN